MLQTARSRLMGYRQIWNMAKGFGLSKPTTINGSRPLLKPGKISPKLSVPAHIMRPPYAETGQQPAWSNSNQIQNEEGIKRMRASGNLAARVLQYAGTLVKPGVTTDEIDKAVHKMIIENNAYPSPLNYGKFPKSVCTSINECVCHGIPDNRPLANGDIVNVDVTVFLHGYHGDTSGMFHVGQVTTEARQLCDVTKRALDAAIKICGPGVPYNKIGKVINEIADNYNYGVVREYVGHGVGQRFHSAPTIQHQRNNHPGVMELWQTFTIEPMFVQGSPKCNTWKDQWTVVTQDGGLAAQWEHTLLITPDGVEILTKA